MLTNLQVILDFVLQLGWRELLVCALVLTPFEYVLPIYKQRQVLRRGLLTDLGHYFLSGIFIRFGMVFLIGGAATLCASLVPAGMQTWVASLPLWLQVILASLIGDLVIYLGHRAMHEIPALWRFHAIHHSSENLDWLAAYRVHPVDQMITKGASLIPIYALGFSAEALFVAAIIYKWQALLEHANIRLPLGPLKYVIVGSEFHHWHHSNEAVARDKNFSAQFPIWDILFKTLYLPGRMPERYGVDDPVPATWAGQIIYPFRRRDKAEPIAEAGKV